MSGREIRGEFQMEDEKVRWDILDAFEGLLENAFDNLLLHASSPAVLHDICGTSCVHKTESNV